MRALSRLVAMLLVFLMTPGLAELVDDAVHLFETGHTEHSEAHGHDGTDAEHGCSGTFHTCSCHQSPSFVPPPEAPVLADSTPVTERWSHRPDAPADGVRRELSRPPAA